VNADIAAQMDKAKESLAAAELLFGQGYGAFATSRAYYTMFYVAEALLSSRGQSYSSHGAVQAAYGREFARRAATWMYGFTDGYSMPRICGMWAIMESV
jgi:uncharacterized protein (UPF0332 family)